VILRENDLVCFFVLSAICLFQLRVPPFQGIERLRPQVRHTVTLTVTTGMGSVSLAKIWRANEAYAPYGEKIEPTLRLLYQAVRDFTSEC
jgi:hypothetical protein